MGRMRDSARTNGDLEECLNLFVVDYQGLGDVRDYESTLSMKIDTCARPHA
jgi:hypothetical protein